MSAKPTTTKPAAPTEAAVATPADATTPAPAEATTPRLTPTELPPRDPFTGQAGHFVVDPTTGSRQPTTPAA